MALPHRVIAIGSRLLYRRRHSDANSLEDLIANAFALALDGKVSGIQYYVQKLQYSGSGIFQGYHDKSEPELANG
ncbi:hypothetical protein [Desulfococcus sp.]|uniref:hypothetical protein n=1 Tax=Desulfococcus sp. TaxID=2025834 RepID=UPI0035935EE8